MFKLNLEKAEEPEIKLLISIGELRKREFQKNINFCFIDYAKALDCVDHNTLWKILKEMAGLNSGLGRSPGEGNGNPLQHSCLENPMDRGA